MPSNPTGTIHAGISGLELKQHRYDLGDGLTLSRSYAHLMAPFMMAFQPAPVGSHHPAPWKAARGGFSCDIDVDLAIPDTLGTTFESKFKIAKTILFLLRLGVDPSVTLPVFSDCAFSDIPSLDDEPLLIPHETTQRHFALTVSDGSCTNEAIEWVVRHWRTTHHLIGSSSIFSFAVDAIDGGQFIREPALALVSLWAAIESIFSPSTTELKFRVSTSIAAFLESPGAERLQVQKDVAKLYNKRSAAAHGKPKHDETDLLASFTLLRRILLKIIEEGVVPTKESLEHSVFGVCSPNVDETYTDNDHNGEQGVDPNA